MHRCMKTRREILLKHIITADWGIRATFHVGYLGAAWPLQPVTGKFDNIGEWPTCSKHY